MTMNFATTLHRALALIAALSLAGTVFAAGTGQAAGIAPAAGTAEPGDTTGLDIRHSLERGAGDTLRVNLRFNGVRAASGAAIQYSTSGSARLLQADAAPLPPGAGVVTRQVTVRVDSDGEPPYLNVFTTQGTRKGVLSIALATDPARQKSTAPGRPASGPAGDRLLVLPGQLRP